MQQYVLDPHASIWATTIVVKEFDHFLEAVGTALGDKIHGLLADNSPLFKDTGRRWETLGIILRPIHLPSQDVPLEPAVFNRHIVEESVAQRGVTNVGELTRPLGGRHLGQGRS